VRDAFFARGELGKPLLLLALFRKWMAKTYIIGTKIVSLSSVARVIKRRG
jgi:hypothetical protein